MNDGIAFIWVLSATLCAWAGARLAERYRFSPVAGCALGTTIYAVIGADFGSIDAQLVGAVYQYRLILICFSLLVGFCFLLLVGQETALGLLKAGAALTLLAVSLTFIPHGEGNSKGYRIHAAIPEGAVFKTIFESQVPASLIQGIRRSRLGFKAVGRATRQTTVHYAVLSAPIPGSDLKTGDWVLVRRSEVREGQDWSEILVPDSKGVYSEETGKVAFVPSNALLFHSIVPKSTG